LNVVDPCVRTPNFAEDVCAVVILKLPPLALVMVTSEPIHL